MFVLLLPFRQDFNRENFTNIPGPTRTGRGRQTVGHLIQDIPTADRKGPRGAPSRFGGPRLACACSAPRSPPSAGPARRPRMCAGSPGSRWPARASAREPPPARPRSGKPEAWPHTLQGQDRRVQAPQPAGVGTTLVPGGPRVSGWEVEHHTDEETET